MAVKKQIEKWQEAYPQLYAQLYPLNQSKLAQYLRLPLVEIDKLTLLWKARIAEGCTPDLARNELILLQFARDWRQSVTV